MNAFKTKLAGKVFRVDLSGSLTERSHFPYDELAGNIKEMHINCKDVDRITSMGVKEWLMFFQKAKEKGLKLQFDECSVAVIDQVNSIVNFLAGGEVSSLYLPFCCGSCGTEFTRHYSMAQFRKINLDSVTAECESCGNEGVFDDISDEYFHLMKGYSRKLQKKVGQFSFMHGFTKKETEVFTLMVSGITSPKDIAAKMGVSNFTVTNHINKLISKCGYGSKTELMAKFIQFIES